MGLFVLAILAAGCAGLPAGTYYPAPNDPNTLRVANVLHRAAVAAGDDPARYSFALIKTRQPAAFTDEDATFYISDGLAQMPTPVLQAVIAHEVAHEVLDHVGTRRRMAVGMTAGFSAAGFFVPGVGLLDFMVNPLVVRAFSRKQELAADQRAVEILRGMGDQAPSGLISAGPGAAAAGAPDTTTTLVPPSQSARPRRSAVNSTPA